MIHTFERPREKLLPLLILSQQIVHSICLDSLWPHRIRLSLSGPTSNDTLNLVIVNNLQPRMPTPTRAFDLWNDTRIWNTSQLLATLKKRITNLKETSRQAIRKTASSTTTRTAAQTRPSPLSGRRRDDENEREYNDKHIGPHICNHIPGDWINGEHSDGSRFKGRRNQANRILHWG